MKWMKNSWDIFCLLFTLLSNFKLCFCLCVCVYTSVCSICPYIYVVLWICAHIYLGAHAQVCVWMKPEINARCLSQSVFILLLRQNLSLNFQLTVIARLNDWCASGICVSLSSRLGLDIYGAALYRVLGINFASWAISVFRWPLSHLLISSPLNSITWTWKAKSLSCRARNTRRAQMHAAHCLCSTAASSCFRHYLINFSFQQAMSFGYCPIVQSWVVLKNMHKIPELIRIKSDRWSVYVCKIFQPIMSPC